MKIEELKKQYKDEWVLIKVEEIDELNRPIEGELVAHSKSRDEIYTKMKKVKGHTYTMYTGKILEKGYAMAFLRNFDLHINFKEGYLELT